MNVAILTVYQTVRMRVNRDLYNIELIEYKTKFTLHQIKHKGRETHTKELCVAPY